jgi:hypothetical protein
VDPNGTLKWLVEQLTHAENRGEKVYISTHQAAADAMEGWARNYYAIVNRLVISAIIINY